MREALLFGALPYAAAALLAVVTAWRCLASPTRRAALPERCRAGARLYAGSPGWRWGLGFVLAAHAGVFLVPRAVLLWDREPSRLLLLEGAGLALGGAALLGLVLLVVRGLPLPQGQGGERPLLESVPDALLLALLAVAIVSGLALSIVHRWGSAWSALVLLPYLRSLAGLHPDTSLVLPLPPLVKLHLLATIAAVAVLPFSRAIYALLWPAVELAQRVAARRRRGQGAEPGGGRGDRRVARVLGAAAELALAATFAVLLMGSLRRVGLSQGYAPEQPIAFSHRSHAGDNKVPCLYCHFAAEKSRHAGIPPAGVCMNCHGQLKAARSEVEKLKEAVEQRRPVAWVKVHNLPDFVYFNHSQHVLRGVACQDCHGPVETMDRVRQAAPLSMGWCLDCHRTRGIVPPPQHAAARRGTAAATGGLDCSKCHY